MATTEDNDLIFNWAHAGPRSASWPARVMLDDETLRDGLQSPSVIDPPVEAKLEILHFMERLGIETANVGLPGAGARQREAVLSLLAQPPCRVQDLVSEFLSRLEPCAHDSASERPRDS